MITIKKTTLIAAYLIATAYAMGGASAWNQYACPKETGAQTVLFTLFVGAVWPIAAAIEILGWKGHGHCNDGSLTLRPAPQVPGGE